MHETNEMCDIGETNVGDSLQPDKSKVQLDKQSVMPRPHIGRPSITNFMNLHDDLILPPNYQRSSQRSSSQSQQPIQKQQQQSLSRNVCETLQKSHVMPGVAQQKQIRMESEPAPIRLTKCVPLVASESLIWSAATQPLQPSLQQNKIIYPSTNNTTNTTTTETLLTETPNDVISIPQILNNSISEQMLQAQLSMTLIISRLEIKLAIVEDKIDKVMQTLLSQKTETLKKPSKKARIDMYTKTNAINDLNAFEEKLTNIHFQNAVVNRLK